MFNKTLTLQNNKLNYTSIVVLLAVEQWHWQKKFTFNKITMFYQTLGLQKNKLHFSVYLGHTVRNFFLYSLGQTVLSWAIFKPRVCGPLGGKLLSINWHKKIEEENNRNMNIFNLKPRHAKNMTQTSCFCELVNRAVPDQQAHVSLSVEWRSAMCNDQ